MAKKRDERIVKSSGNVFADLGLAHSEEALAKAKLMHFISQAIERRGWSQSEAAVELGVSQSNISNIARGSGRSYSLEKLSGIVHKLNGTVTIEVKVEKCKERIALYA
uniref:Putative Transcriptional regulator, XRE family n=1 Tax=mine drainage metagenome TaxID=410659 RepID=E6Q5G7_9ZZZZ